MTVALLGMSLSLVAWIYLRDRDPNWQPPERQITRAEEYKLARADAAVTLSNALRGVECRSGCASEVLSRAEARSWLIRITLRRRAWCLRIDLDRFMRGQHHALFGLRRTRCTVRRNSHP